MIFKRLGRDPQDNRLDFGSDQDHDLDPGFLIQEFLYRIYSFTIAIPIDSQE